MTASGTIPEAAHDLLRLARLRVLARAAGVARIDAGPAGIALTPRGNVPLPEVAGLVAKERRWLLAEAIAEPGGRAERIDALLSEIADA